jgi:parallel beta-helix repeat protein
MPSEYSRHDNALFRPIGLLLTALLTGLTACGGGSTSEESAPNSGTSGAPGTTMTALGLRANAATASEGLPAAVVPPGTTNASTFYVDSSVGNDANDGLSDAAAGAGRGPWRTLARVMLSAVGPGDTVRLGCGSEWNETLRLPASGAPGLPIRVMGPTAGCVNRPVIDGSVRLSNSAWSSYRGSIYKAKLTAPPLQLASGERTVWSEAHHPNRGYRASAPDTPYLATAAASVTSIVNGRPVSNTIVTGSDLVLPPGASITPGTRARVRTYSWLIEDVAVSAVNGPVLTLSAPMSYPLGAGWGYFLYGQLWMVDSAGEWFYDAAAQQLYANFPEGLARLRELRATVLPVGIDLKGRDNVVVEGLVVRRVGVGADLRWGTAAVIRNTSFEDIADMGADVTGSVNATVDTNTFTRTGADAISGWRENAGIATGLLARNNVIQDSGVLMRGEQVLSQPRLSYAAIYAGPNATVTGNRITNAGYIGILALASSVVEKNSVSGACSVLDDCAGIFTQTSSGSVIRGNTVTHSRGTTVGKPASEAFTLAHGIYLDEFVSGALVEDNTVSDADAGILLHVSSHNTVRGNRLYGNRRSQIWLQGRGNGPQGAADMVDNTVVDNQIAPLGPTAAGIVLETQATSTAAFGTIDRNRYFDGLAPTVVRVSTASGVREFTFAQWQRGTETNLPLGRDLQGTATSAAHYTTFRVTGDNIVPNNTLASNAAGWTSWTMVPNSGDQLVPEACPAGMCLRYTAGSSLSAVLSPNFSIVRGQWYRLSVDLAAGHDGQAVELAVRRGGGAANGYEGLSDRGFALIAGRSWQRYSQVFQATQTVNAHDPVTGDLGARVDLTPIRASTSISLANMELVPVTPDAAALAVTMQSNTGSSAAAQNCPYVASQPALCTKLRRLSDDAWMAWPYSLPGNSAAIFYAQEVNLIDSDGDGIPDVQDFCPGTLPDQAVNAKGCPLVLR